jgi:hypothetical protein
VFSVPKTSPNLGKAFNTEDARKFKRANQASAKSDPFVIVRRENQMSERHARSKNLNLRKNEQFRIKPLPPVSSHPAETSALVLGAPESSPFRVILQIRRFLWSGMAFPYGTGGSVC